MIESHLTPQSIATLSLFCGAVALVYYLSLRWLLLKLRRREPHTAVEKAFMSRWTGVVLLGAAGFGLACMAYGFFIEPFRLTVTTYRLETAKLPADVSFRVVHIADLHTRGWGPCEEALPELVASLEPDVILHSGDFYGSSSPEAFAAVKKLLASWDVPQYGCLGNCDYYSTELIALLEESQLNLLDWEKTPFEAGGHTIWLAGCSAALDRNLMSFLEELPADTFNILLFHYPAGFPIAKQYPTGLMLAGHTHGGQVRLPGYGAVITMDPTGKRYEWGRFDEYGSTLIVSRGIGCEPAVPEVRFLCPPEVAVIDIVGTGKAGAS